MEQLLFVAGTSLLLLQVWFWSTRLFDMVQALVKVPCVDPDADDGQVPDSPFISVIIPAHNEEAGIEKCVRSVLRQDYPRFELIVVDDRSVDDTASIVNETARGHANVKLISVLDLPPGWTGKCHALDVGVGYARGEWLAFLDADSRLHPAALRQCYTMARRHNVNMMTLSPRLVVKSFWEKVLQPVFAGVSCILYPLARINDPQSKVASANGMFYLISRRAYGLIGGHRDVRNLAVEDIGIGKRIKAAGLGLLFVNGRRVLETRMYATVNEIIKGWTRIISASMNYELGKALRQLSLHALVSAPVVAIALFWYIPHAWDLWPNAWIVLPALLAAESCLVSVLFYPQLGVPTRYAAFVCVGNLVVVGVLIVIIKKILWKDALQWRGTTYAGSRYEPTCLEPTSTEVCRSTAPPMLGRR